MSSNRNESNDVVMFFVGLVMTVVGGYLFMQNVEVYAPSIFSFRMFGRDMDGLIFIPLICGISFEILRFVGRHDDNPFFKGLSKPGLWLQKFTTAEPDDSIIEVAIAAMQAVIPENDNDDNW